MTTLIDFVLRLFRDGELGKAFAADPSGTLTGAGFAEVTPSQLASVATAAVPQLALQPEDPIAGLQRVVSQHHSGDSVAPFSAASSPGSEGAGFASGNSLLSDIPIATEASHNDTEVHDNTTQLGSHNLTELASPELAFGDVVFGDKNSASGDGAVAISGTASGDIVSGDGAMLGDGNEVYNGDLQTGSNSNIAYGRDSGVIQDNIDWHEDTGTQVASTAAADPEPLAHQDAGAWNQWDDTSAHHDSPVLPVDDVADPPSPAEATPGFDIFD